MKKIKLSLVDRASLEDKLKDKYQKIGGLKVIGVDVSQGETVNTDLIATIRFCHGFLAVNTVVFRYYNEELFVVSGDDLEMKFIDEMKNLLKEYKK